MVRMLRPVHPGTFVRNEVLEPLALSVTEAAQVLEVSRPALSALLNGRAAMSPEMAMRIELAFGPKMETLVGMQANFDAAQIRARQHEYKIERYRPPAARATA